MTPSERCTAAFRGEPVDRAPVAGGFVCHDGWLAHVLGITVDEYWRDPVPYAIEAYRRAGTDMIIQFVLPKRPEQATSGTSGRSTNFGKKERRPEDEFPTVDSVIDWVRKQPTAEDYVRTFDRQKYYDFYLGYVREKQTAMEPMVWMPGHVIGCPSFQGWYGHFGYENFFVAMVEAPEVFSAFFHAIGERRRLENAAAAQATLDHDLIPIVYCGEDICYSAGPLCSPGLLAEVYTPALVRAFEPLKDAGMKIVWHSDGYIMPIIDQLFAAGVDGFQGLEEDHGMSLEKIAGLTNRDGEPVILWGSVSVTSTLPHGTVADVRADVHRCLEIGARHGGRLFLAPSSSVGPEVPVENIVELFRAGVEDGPAIYRQHLAPAAP